MTAIINFTALSSLMAMLSPTEAFTMNVSHSLLATASIDEAVGSKGNPSSPAYALALVSVVDYPQRTWR
jgi:hypothetical protein